MRMIGSHNAIWGKCSFHVFSQQMGIALYFVSMCVKDWAKERQERSIFQSCKNFQFYKVTILFVLCSVKTLKNKYNIILHFTACMGTLIEFSHIKVTHKYTHTLSLSLLVFLRITDKDRCTHSMMTNYMMKNWPKCDDGKLPTIHITEKRNVLMSVMLHCTRSQNCFPQHNFMSNEFTWGGLCTCRSLWLIWHVCL